MFRRKWRSWLVWLVVSLCVLTLLFEVAVLLNQATDGGTPSTPYLGNRRENLQRLADLPPADEFGFAVAGDTREVYAFQALAERLESEPIDFLVVVGDFVPSASAKNHRFFRLEFSDETHLDRPVLLIPGNHDISDKSAESFGPAQFEELYGSSHFTMVFRGCFFVFLSIVGDSNLDAPSIDLLRDLVKTHRAEDYRKTFVFMHIASPVMGDVEKRRYRSVDEAGQLIARLEPDYVFSGHYHGYARKTVGRTTYIITGGGGDDLAPRALGHFHHAMVMRVGPDSVSEDILPLPNVTEQSDRFEKYLLTDAYPWLRRNRSLAVFLTFGLLATLFVLVGRLWLRRGDGT